MFDTCHFCLRKKKKYIFLPRCERVIFLKKIKANEMSELKHLSLVASLREVFAGENKALKKECIDAIGMKAIAQALPDYPDFFPLVKHLKKRDLNELVDAAETIQFDRKKFCRFVQCKRAEALQHPHAFSICGEFGGDYGYFVGVRWDEGKRVYEEQEMSENDIEQLYEYKECCYNNGQPCGQWRAAG